MRTPDEVSFSAAVPAAFGKKPDAGADAQPDGPAGTSTLGKVALAGGAALVLALVVTFLRRVLA